MIDDKNILKKYNIKPFGYTKKNNAVIIDTKEQKYVLKKRIKNNKDLFNYLKSRSFDYFPYTYNDDVDDTYDIYQYYENINLPVHEKTTDLINLVSLLHSKTTHYKDIDIDDYKIIYENIAKRLDYLVSYYSDIFDLIDTEVYMSPSNYLLARNISKINSLLNFCNNELDEWYELIKDKDKERVSLIHNNLELDHLIRNDNASYLISWDRAKMDMPIYDLYNFYKKNSKDINFDEALSIYESRYPLSLEEKKLLFLLISIPEKIDFSNDEYENTKKVDELLMYIYKTDKIISPYYPKKKTEEYNEFNK